MPTARTILEKTKRLLTEFGVYVFRHKFLTLAWVLIGLPLASFFAWILIETNKFDNMGFQAKTLWDWMDLLLVPVALGVGIWWLERSEKSNEQLITTDTQRSLKISMTKRNRVCCIHEGQTQPS